MSLKRSRRDTGDGEAAAQAFSATRFSFIPRYQPPSACASVHTVIASGVVRARDRSCAEARPKRCLQRRPCKAPFNLRHVPQRHEPRRTENRVRLGRVADRFGATNRSEPLGCLKADDERRNIQPTPAPRSSQRTQRPQTDRRTSLRAFRRQSACGRQSPVRRQSGPRDLHVL